MPFQRKWDASCPKIYEQWEDAQGKWFIQDLIPEDDEKAVKLMIEHFLPDDVLCKTCGLSEDVFSVEFGRKGWTDCTSKRISIACYKEEDGCKDLVGLNMCGVKCIDDVSEDFNEDLGSDAHRQMMMALNYIERNVDIFKELGVDKYLVEFGLVIRKDMRGARLGGKILRAREPMCRLLGIKASVTLFTGKASQKLAKEAGFHTLWGITFAELADNGLNFPRDPTVILKYMARKYE